MSLSKTTLSAIQQAGQALHKATVVVASAVRDQAEHMVATVASQPFQAEGEQAFANFKMLAHLSQELQALEEQLRHLYATAADLASPVMDVVTSLPRPGTPARSATRVPTDSAEDAVVKPASTRSDPRGSRPASRRSSGKAAGRTANRKAAKAAALTANDAKVLNYLKTVLQRGAWTPLTGASVAAGAGLPLGSVGISLKKVVASGAVKKRGRGSYRLAA